jgi:polysaccharide export outer membrane protein
MNQSHYKTEEGMNFFGELRARWWLVPLMFLLVISFGCQGVQPVVKESRQEPVPTVTLGPGDTIEFKFFNNPELNDAQTIRPDGKITLQLIGEVTAEGKTPLELRKELIKRYTPDLRTPEVTVIVRSLYDRRVYVGGEVKNPGLITMPGPLTALEAIMQVGGFDPKTGKIKKVIIIRHKNNKWHGYMVDYKNALKTGEGLPFYLEPRDIVYVPRTNIAKLNQWIDQYINKIIPRTGLNFTYPIGAGFIGVDTSTAVAVP